MIFTLFTVLTPHCTFRNVTGGAVVVTTWMVLRRSPSMEAFVNAFKEAVLPFGNCVRAISDGSIRFALQAGGEVTLTVHIDEDEYRNKTRQRQRLYLSTIIVKATTRLWGRA